MSEAVLDKTTQDVDGPALLKRENEAELARRQGKAPEPKPGEPAKPADPNPRRASGDRRRFRELYTQIGELTGRLKAYEEGHVAAKPGEKPEAKPAAETAAPDRKQFPEGAAGDAEFAEAQRKHEIRTEASRVLDERRAAEGETQEFSAIRAAMDAETAKAKEEFPDWDEVIAKGNKTELPGRLDVDCPVLFMSLLKSAKASVPVYNDLIYHFAKNPEVLTEWMKREMSAKGMEKRKGEQVVGQLIEEFRELCGELRAEKKRRTPAGKKEEKPEPARASSDAARGKEKPAPSATAEVRAGSAASVERPDPEKDPAGYLRYMNEREKGPGNVRPR